MDFTAVLEEMRQQLGFKAEFTTVLLTMALLVSRVLPVIVLTPMFGGETTPTEVKFGLGTITALVLFPGVIDRMQYIPLTPVPFVALLMKEVFVGYSIAFVVGLVFDAANVAGQLIDNMSGTNNAQLMVPSIGQQVSLYAVLKVQLCITLFLTLNGHHLVLEALADSLALIPLDSFPRFSHGSFAFYDLIMRVFGDLLRIALAISAPVVLATFLTDLALGLINRTAPQIQVFFVSMQIKPAVTALVMFAAIHLILLRVVDEYGVMFRWLREALRLMS